MEGSPKKWAEDVAGGLVSLNAVAMKRVVPSDIKLMWVNLQMVLKEIRSSAVAEGDHDALKAKSMKMGRINQAMMVINAFAKKNKLPL